MRVANAWPRSRSIDDVGRIAQTCDMLSMMRRATRSGLDPG